MSGLAIAFDDSGRKGSVALDGPHPAVAGLAGTWTARFAAGPDGLPAESAIAFVRRWPSDWDIPQCADPVAPGYTTVRIAQPCRHRWRTRRSIEWHPFDHVFELLFDDPLPPRAAVDVVFGDGPSGMRAQTFIEEACALSVRVRAGAGAWTEVARLAVPVVAGAAARADLIAPSDVAVGEEFELALRIEDLWGNPAELLGEVRVEVANCATLPSLPGVRRWTARIDVTGITRPVAHTSLGTVHANPVAVHAAAPARRIRWGDLHAQCLIGCGARTIDAFFAHGRDFARLDFASHQANCFLVSNDEWRETETITARYNEAGRYVTLLGLEWSADTARGGDRNLFFPGNEAPITRCSHEYVDDKSDLASDLPEARDLHAKYRGTRTLVGYHVGGRTTDLSRHEPSLERLIEVHSTHATSEWFLFDALDRGYRLGVTAGSDGVDGRPGASHPGHQAVRNVRGGLVAVPLSELNRKALWEALAARHCYATDGARIRIEFTADGHAMGEEFVSAESPLLSFAVDGTSTIEAVDFFRGSTLLHSAPLRASATPLSDRIRIAWSGATAPGNFSKARMRWDGHATLSEGRFDDVAGHAFDTADEGITAVTGGRIEWRSMTGGDWDGITARIEAPPEALLSVHTPQISASVPVGALDAGSAQFADTKPKRELEIRFLPADLGSTGWRGAWRDPMPLPGWNAYWVRVRQWDGATAWTSPVFVEIRR